jgi:hypothetical protein
MSTVSQPFESNLNSALNHMKKILGVIASFLIAASVHANTYTDNNQADVYLNVANPSYTGQFTLAGYNPAAETITSANAVFTFWDNSLRIDQGESLTVTMSGDDLSHGSFSGFLTLGDNIVNAWGILDSTGVLSYTVSLTSAWYTEFWLTNASLTAETASRSVPDAGATAILLGLGVIGILGAKRRFASVA